jgi:hypothetical protein
MDFSAATAPPIATGTRSGTRLSRQAVVHLVVGREPYFTKSVVEALDGYLFYVHAFDDTALRRLYVTRLGP